MYCCSNSSSTSDPRKRQLLLLLVLSKLRQCVRSLTTHRSLGSVSYSITRNKKRKSKLNSDFSDKLPLHTRDSPSKNVHAYSTYSSIGI